MKILFVTPRFPYPPLKGDQVVSYHRLRTLSQRHEITLITFYQNSSELVHIEQINPYCKAIHTIQLSKWQSCIKVLQGLFFSKLPLQVSYYYSSFLKKQLDLLIDFNEFDLIHAFMLRITPYCKHISTPKIVELIDSMQLNLERRIALESIPKRWIFQEELRRIIDYEGNICNLFDRLIVVSSKDKELIADNRVEVIPLGINTELFRPAYKLPVKQNLIFSGNMGYSPNINAVIWFVKNCLTIIKQKIPTVSLVIAGANPSKEIRDLGQIPGVKVTGFVKSMPETLRQANIAIAPMQSGSGMQFKILEAMASGLPVVTTTLGLGDLKAKPDKEILIANTPETFAKAIINLLENFDLARDIGNQARKYVVNNHSWDFAANQVEKIYHQIIKS